MHVAFMHVHTHVHTLYTHTQYTGVIEGEFLFAVFRELHYILVYWYFACYHGIVNASNDGPLVVLDSCSHRKD